MDLSATLINSWPPDCNAFLFFSHVPIWSFAAWSIKSQLLLGIFLGIKIPVSRPNLDAKKHRFWKRSWVDFGAKLGAKIDQKSIQEGIEKMMKKGHQDGKQIARRPCDAARPEVSRVREGGRGKGKPFSKGRKERDRSSSAS